jgi:hypothetical protein
MEQSLHHDSDNHHEGSPMLQMRHHGHHTAVAVGYVEYVCCDSCAGIRMVYIENDWQNCPQGGPDDSQGHGEKGRSNAVTHNEDAIGISGASHTCVHQAQVGCYPI